MKFPLPSWVKKWMVYSSVLVLYDAAYVLLRPYSLAEDWNGQGTPAGPLASLFAPYNHLYQNVDKVYSVERYKTGDRFCEAQALCNIVEVFLQFYALRLHSTRGREAAGLILAFTTQAFTFWKTMLYWRRFCSEVPTKTEGTWVPCSSFFWLYDIVGGFAHTKDNNFVTLMFVYVLTNIWWIILPLFAMLDIGLLMGYSLQRSDWPSHKFTIRS